MPAIAGGGIAAPGDVDRHVARFAGGDRELIELRAGVPLDRRRAVLAGPHDRPARLAVEPTPVLDGDAIDRLAGRRLDNPHDQPAGRGRCRRPGWLFGLGRRGRLAPGLRRILRGVGHTEAADEQQEEGAEVERGQGRLRDDRHQKARRLRAASRRQTPDLRAIASSRVNPATWPVSDPDSVGLARSPVLIEESLISGPSSRWLAPIPSLRPAV